MARKTVLVAGATGLVGYAALKHFAAEDTAVIGVSRRVPPGVPSARHLRLDLTNAAACRDAAEALRDVTHLVYAALFELPTPTIAVGESANLTLVDLDAEWIAGEHGWESRSENCCFAGRTLQGRVLMTLAAGAIAHRDRALAMVGA